MSLKAFHIFFVAVSVLLAFGFAAWAFVNFAQQGQWLDLVWGGLGIVSGLALIWYGKFVLKKLKGMSYL